MPEELYSTLINHRATAAYTSATDYVFACSTCAPVDPDRLRETLQSVLRERLHIALGIKGGWVALLRHTSGSWVCREKGHREAQAALGHSDITTTLRVYTHLAEGTEEQV